MDCLPYPADDVPPVGDTAPPVSPGPLARLLPLLGQLHLVVPGPPADWDAALSAGADDAAPAPTGVRPAPTGVRPAPTGVRPAPGTRARSAADGGLTADQQGVAATE